MDKTNYEELIKKRQQERQAKLASVTVLHEVVKHLNSDGLLKALAVTKSALSDAETAEKISNDTGISLEELVDTLDKATLCLRFTAY
jgi:hypothetical protein